ncbi:hypothetical protein AG1IA_09958 [Rhizoctonia solani AG-1 IA]|uniref:Uncharacterized protein n=1 Tax=Thanatephorus cucumeris (strain AG1-IA) TaxID=983506 RepID=L8WH05_THACA|nr:hypothetical protein AG1IA_09958 [Rhizoctonia solani AG-1 IA]
MVLTCRTFSWWGALVIVLIFGVNLKSNMSRRATHACGSSKAVADGAVIWSTLSSVSSRAPRYSFGTTIALPFLANVHRRQYRIPYKNARGEQVVSGGWSQIVQKGVALDSEVVCRRPYVQLHTTPDPNLELFTADLLAYSGENTPEWARDPFGNLASGFQEACTIRANLQHLEGALVSAMGKHGSRYWTLQFDICIRFGGTELESYLEWEDNVGIFDSYMPLETDNKKQGIKRTGPVSIVPQDTIDL